MKRIFCVGMFFCMFTISLFADAGDRPVSMRAVESVMSVKMPRGMDKDKFIEYLKGLKNSKITVRHVMVACTNSMPENDNCEECYAFVRDVINEHNKSVEKLKPVAQPDVPGNITKTLDIKNNLQSVIDSLPDEQNQPVEKLKSVAQPDVPDDFKTTLDVNVDMKSVIDGIPAPKSCVVGYLHNVGYVDTTYQDGGTFQLDCAAETGAKNIENRKCNCTCNAGKWKCVEIPGQKPVMVAGIDINKNGKSIKYNTPNEWSVTFDYGTVSGKSQCSATEKGATMPDKTTGDNCWCMVTKLPTRTGMYSWVWYKIEAGCNSNNRCAYKCANAVQYDKLMRQDMFGI
jgi:hypothetical protein